MALAYLALKLTASKEIDLQNLAKGEENTSRIELYKGKPYTAFTVTDIKALIKQRAAADGENKRILWLGFSQLHYINQYRKGDHLSPYWLRNAWSNPDALEPLGCSLPNANIQEYLILSRYAVDRIPVNMVIVSLVFDKLREDGLRQEFSEILTSDTTAEIRQSSKTADNIIQRFKASGEGAVGGEDVLADTWQLSMEQWMNDKLSAISKLWSDRRQIEGNVFVVLYNLRNWAFGIKPTTVRKVIPARYERNMDALRDMLDDLQQRSIPILLYIVPIRQDKPIPYENDRYIQWQIDVAAMAHQYGARLVNLEKLVPGELWGSYTGNELDFMHFQGEGHRLVAEALFPHVKEMLKGGTQ